MEVMELSDLHHPNCKINRKLNSGNDLGVGAGDPCRRESESSDSILLSPEASKATEAVEFIAEHLRNEDLYIQVFCLSFNHQSIRLFYFLYYFFILDSRGLEICSNGYRSSATIYIFYCDNSGYRRYINGCTPYF